MYAHNPYDHERLRSQRRGDACSQGIRARRYSTDPARSGWYAFSRTVRFARFLGRVVEVSCIAYAMSRGRLE